MDRLSDAELSLLMRARNEEFDVAKTDFAALADTYGCSESTARTVLTEYGRAELVAHYRADFQGSPDEFRVLLVEDEEDVGLAYAMVLSDRWNVRLATTGAEAREAIDPTLDVVLLDLRLPDDSGYEIAESIAERDADPLVIALTGVDPDFDIVERNFDGYLSKPVGTSDLRSVVADLEQRREYPDLVREYLSLLEKKAALEAEYSDRKLAASEEYEELERRIAKRRTAIEETVDLTDPSTFASLATHMFSGGE